MKKTILITLLLVMFVSTAFANTAGLFRTMSDGEVREIAVPANDLAAAWKFILDSPGTYTMYIDRDISTSTIRMSRGSTNLTIIGLGGERTISFNGKADEIMFIIDNSSNVSLNIGENITLKGVSNSNTHLVYVSAGIFRMNEGSKITGHTTSLFGGAVGLVGSWSRFYMLGGEIVGNISTSSHAESSGGVFVRNGATFIMRGGSVTDNLRNTTEPMDVNILRDARPFIQTGGTIGTLKNSAPKPIDFTQRSSVEMVRINGGSFNMGSPDNEHDRHHNEGPQRRVTLSPFSMGKFAVTNELYEAVMGANIPSGFPRRPVEGVSFFEAIAFCNKLSILQALTPAYIIGGETDPAKWGNLPKGVDSDFHRWDTVQQVAGANGYRLPSEAQWEFAARAGTTTPFHTGENITTNQANYNGEQPYRRASRGENRRRTTDVGSFPPNAWGLHDMHGNVWEWCWDRYESEYPEENQTDPMGPDTGTTRVLRGGAWSSSGTDIRSANRLMERPYRSGRYGLRVVLP
jgi:formylglycine-generating enzyme required for sulfatase activity